MSWSKEKQAAYYKIFASNNAARLKEYKDTWYQRNKPRVLKLQNERRFLKRDEISRKNAQYRALNPVKIKATRDAWRAAHPNASRDWHKKNSDKNAARVRAYKARMLCATPRWANKFFIDEAYHLAALRTKTLGFKWHVDHIVPLKSKIVCGFHTEVNLRVIPGTENIRKGNRFWPDMPEIVRQGSLSVA